MEAKGIKKEMERGRKIVIPMIAMCLMSAASQAQTLKINVQDAQFTMPFVERLVAEYHKMNPEFKAEVVRTAQGADAQVSLSVLPDDYESTVGRFIVLPVANSQNELLKNKKVQRGLSERLKHQIYVERDVVEVLEAEEAGEKQLPGTVYTLFGSKAVTSQVLAKSLNVGANRIKGKKILGREENLLTAVTSHSDAVSYNVATLIYDAKSHQPVSGLTVLAEDLDGNGRISDEERAAIASLDTLTDYLESLPKTSVATGSVNIKTDNAQIREFVNWVIIDGQSYLAQYGLLKTPTSLTAQNK